MSVIRGLNGIKNFRRLERPGILRRVDWWVVTDVSKTLAALTFKFEPKQRLNAPSKSQYLYQPTLSNILLYLDAEQHRCENLKLLIKIFIPRNIIIISARHFLSVLKLKLFTSVRLGKCRNSAWNWVATASCHVVLTALIATSLSPCAMLFKLLTLS